MDISFLIIYGFMAGRRGLFRVVIGFCCTPNPHFLNKPFRLKNIVKNFGRTINSSIFASVKCGKNGFNRCL